MQRRMEQVCLGLHMALAFFLPFSTSAVSVTACLILLCWLLEGRYAKKLREMAASPLGPRLCRGAAPRFVLDRIPSGWPGRLRKQWKLLVAPFLLTTIRWEWRQRYVVAFIAGVTATMLAVPLDQFDLLQRGLSEDELFFHTLTVQLQYTPMLAFTALLTVHLFTTMGRTGHFAFFVLMIVLLFQHYRKNLLRAGLIAAVLFPLVFGTGDFRFDPNVQEA